MLPIEVQGYIRHFLHAIGLMIVARGGLDGSHLEIYVGGMVNCISLAWFLYFEYKKSKNKKKEQEA